MKAIGRIAAKASCTVTIDKITRVSNDGAILADELSKGRFTTFKSKLPEGWTIRQEPAWIPPSILAWIALPAADHNLGDKIISDIIRKFGQL